MRSYDRGFTLIELLVTTLLGGFVLASAVQFVMASQGTYQRDLARTRLNQNLRSALDIIGIDTRQAGENLISIFPAVEIIDGGAGTDELILRRNLLDEVLNVCGQLDQGSSGNSILFGLSSTLHPGCIYQNQTRGFDAWQAHRTAQGGGQAQVYIYDSVTKKGQFLTYSSELDTGTEYYITSPSSTTWVTTYSVGSAGVYALEEWRYRVQDEYLQLIVNGDEANPLNVAHGITDFQVQAVMADGSVLNSLTAAERWTEIEALNVSLSGEDSDGKTTVQRTLNASFFPRNVLSN